MKYSEDMRLLSSCLLCGIFSASFAAPLEITGQVTGFNASGSIRDLIGPQLGSIRADGSFNLSLPDTPASNVVDYSNISRFLLPSACEDTYFQSVRDVLFLTYENFTLRSGQSDALLIPGTYNSYPEFGFGSFIRYIYVTRDVTVRAKQLCKGRTSGEYSTVMASLDLKQGWNAVRKDISTRKFKAFELNDTTWSVIPLNTPVHWTIVKTD